MTDIFHQWSGTDHIEFFFHWFIYILISDIYGTTYPLFSRFTGFQVVGHPLSNRPSLLRRLRFVYKGNEIA